MAELRALKRKMVIVGDYGAGKTAFLQHAKIGAFNDLFNPALYENYVIDLSIDGRTIELALWDTAAQEDYNRLRPLAYPNTAVMVLAFAIDSRESFENINERWYPEIMHFCTMPRLPIVVLGLKSDLRRQKGMRLDREGPRDVTEEEGQALANRLGAFGYSECSAKTGEGVNEALEIVGRAAISWDPLVKDKRERKCLVV